MIFSCVTGSPVWRLHDYDDNNLLDGIEIMAAISHIVPHDPDLDLGRQPEGNVLTAEQQLRLKAAQQSKADQIEHFTSKNISSFFLLFFSFK